MSPEQFQEFLKSNEKATGHAIEKHVNGKIRDLVEQLTSHIDKSEIHWEKSNTFMVKTDKFMEEMRPVREGLLTAQSLAKFFKWIGLPSIAVVGYWLISKL